MPLAHSIKILFTRPSFIFKVMIYKVAVAVLAASVILIFAYGAIENLYYEGAFESFNNIVLKGSTQGVFLSVRDALSSFWHVLIKSGELTTVVLTSLAFVFLFCFLISLDDIAQGEVIYARISANCRVSYTGSLLKKLWLATKYALFKMVYLIVSATLTILILIASSKMLDSGGFFGIISPFVLIFEFIVIVSAFFTLFGGHVAAILTTDEKVFKNFFVNLKMALRSFFRLYLLNFLLVTLILFINYVFASVLFGVFLIFTVPASFALVSIFNFVMYLDASGSRYYVDANTIVSPKKNEYYDKVKDLIDLI